MKSQGILFLHEGGHPVYVMNAQAWAFPDDISNVVMCCFITCRLLFVEFFHSWVFKLVSMCVRKIQ